MPGFSIEDVRDTLPTDVRRMLDRIGEAAGAWLGGRHAGAPADGAADPRLAAIEHAGHALFGTTSLVGAQSLAGSARAMEELSRRAQEELRLAEAHAARARRAVELCQDGVGAMRRMLALELERKAGEALLLALSWQERAEELPAAPAAADAAAPPPTAATPPPPSSPTATESVAPDEAPFDFTDRSEDPRFRAELDEVFRAELEEACRALAEQFERLDATPGDVAAWSLLERVLHSVKGAAATVGRVELSEAFATLRERVEGLVDGARPLGAGDVRELLDQVNGVLRPAGAAPLQVRSSPQRDAVPSEHHPELAQAFAQECRELLEQLEQAALRLESSPDPREVLRELLRATHTLKGVVNTMGLAPTGRVAHRVEDLLEALLGSAVLPPLHALASLLLSVQAGVRRNLQTAAEGYVETDLAGLEQELARLLRLERTPMGAAAPVPVPAPGQEGRHDVRQPERSFIRVETGRLDALMNLVGELVVSRSRLLDRVGGLRGAQHDLERGYRRLTDTVEAFRDDHEFALASRGSSRVPAAVGPTVSSPVPAPWGGFSELELDRYEDVQMLARSLAELSSDFTEVHHQLARGMEMLTEDADLLGGIVGGIQGEVTRARMVPLETLFARLQLPLREAAERSGKEVRLVLDGEDVSLDKTIADALLQPMLHLVRNAVAHGIEAPPVRLAAGKEPVGTVRLRARQASGQIVVEVSDDGAGLDLARLRARGLELGLLSAEAAESEAAVRDLVFAAGLSTSPGADQVSGRGVGGEVVRRAVERLNGSARVESLAGQGSTFLLTLPLTLTITRATLVREGGRAYAIPMSFADRLVDAGEAELLESAGQQRIKLDGTWVTLRSLGEVLGGEAGVSGPAILSLRVGDQRAALRAAEVIGQEEIVVKDLGPILGGHPLFAGVAVRGSGELVLILDVPRLLGGQPARLPAAAAPPLLPRAHRPGEPAASAPARRVSVLFVDDSISVRKVAERTLRDLGVEVETATNGEEALLRLRERRFDMLFTDLEMPRMHGYELVRELRFLPEFRALPVVVVTSRSGQKHQQQAMALGASQYITKPFTTEVIRAALERWTGPGFSA